MGKRRPPDLEMNIDGSFRSPPQAPLMVRIGIIALVIGVLAGALVAAALALWFALALVPVAVVALAVAWIAFRIQLWRLRRSARARRDVYPI